MTKVSVVSRTLYRALVAIGLLLTACRPRYSRSEIWAGPSYFVPGSVSHNANTAVDPDTHQLRHAQSVWSFADSIQWAGKQDEILTALRKLGAKPVVCTPKAGARGFANAQYWRFSDFYLKVRGFKEALLSGRSLPWIESIEIFSRLPLECVD